MGSSIFGVRCVIGIMYSAMHRVFDVLVSVLGLTVLAFILPFVVFAILFEDGAPVFIECRRVSAGRVIKVFKFRSMVKNARALKRGLMSYNERADGVFFKMRRDPRVTGVGRFIRRFKIDEFPQFVNVLKGDISLVGPRPHEPAEVRRYPRAFHKLRFARCGLTGPAQATGDAFLPFYTELNMDLNYLRSRSFLGDARIILRTIGVVLSGRGV